MSAELISVLKDIASTPFTVNKLPKVEYTVDDLLTIVESHPHPAIRRIAANMLYTMGRRDQTVCNIEALS